MVGSIFFFFCLFQLLLLYIYWCSRSSYTLYYNRKLTDLATRKNSLFYTLQCYVEFLNARRLHTLNCDLSYARMLNHFWECTRKIGGETFVLVRVGEISKPSIIAFSRCKGAIYVVVLRLHDNRKSIEKFAYNRKRTKWTIVLTSAYTLLHRMRECGLLKYVRYSFRRNYTHNANSFSS